MKNYDDKANTLACNRYMVYYRYVEIQLHTNMSLLTSIKGVVNIATYSINIYIRKGINNMTDKNTFIVISDDGKEIECEVLFAFEDNNRHFIAYTNNDLDAEGNTKVFASIFDPTEDEPTLEPIESEDDWKLVEGILNELTKQ